MPRPIFNVILTLDNDLASVRTDFTDHFCGTRYSGRKQRSVGFVPLGGLGGAIDHRAGFNCRAGGSAPCGKSPVFLVFTMAVFLSACGQGPQGPKGVAARHPQALGHRWRAGRTTCRRAVRLVASAIDLRAPTMKCVRTTGGECLASKSGGSYRPPRFDQGGGKRRLLVRWSPTDCGGRGKRQSVTLKSSQ